MKKKKQLRTAEKMKNEKHDLGMQTFAASFQPKTFDENKRTVDIVWTTGAQVQRFDWWTGRSFMQELSLKTKDVRLDRIRAGAPLLEQHGEQRRGLDDVLAVIESVNFKKDDDGNRKGFATVRFSKRARAQEILDDVLDGILPNISVGFQIHVNEEVGETEDGMTILRAVDWEPHEFSLVAMPADIGAQVRSNIKTNLCEFHLKGNDMPKKVETAPKTIVEPTEVRTTETPKVDVGLVQREAVAAERKRVEAIKLASRSAKMTEEYSEKLITDGVTVDQAREMIIAELAKKDTETVTRSANVSIVKDELDTFKTGMQDALSHRANSSRVKLTDVGREFRGMTMLRMAETYLNIKNVSTRGLSNQQIAKLVLRAGSHSSSDFPEILANVAGKSLRDSYEGIPQTFDSMVRKVQVADFKEISRTSLGDAARLLEIQEGGETKQGTISEEAEKYFVKEYGRSIVFSRKMLINDDMDALSRMPEKFGLAARDLESQLIWDLLISNPLMADGKTLFHADHNNIGTGGVISVAAVGEMRANMRKQVGLDGLRINVAPKNLFVPVALETVAEQFTGQIVPDQAGSVNPHAGRLTPIGEPRLDDNSALAWYLMAEASRVDMIEMATLIGESGPMMDTDEDFDTKGLKMDVRYDLGVKIIDYRGFQRNAGV